MSGPTELPIACSLDASGLETRREEWRRLTGRALRERSDTDAGVRLRFAADEGVAEALRRLARLESECCGFAQWRVSAEERELVLDVTSTGDGVAAVRELFSA